MLWSSASLVVAGLVMGCTVGAPLLIVGSIAIVLVGIVTSTGWQAWLTHLAVFQAAYLAALLASTAWSRRRRARPG